MDHRQAQRRIALLLPDRRQDAKLAVPDLENGFVRVAVDGEELLDQRARRARQSGACTERRLFEEAVRDLANRTAADRIDASNGQQVRHQRVRGLRIGARHRGEHALIFRPFDGGGAHQPIEIVGKASRAVEVLHQAALPGGAEIERGDQRAEQPDIAHADFRRHDAVVRGRLQPEREHFGIGRGGVAPCKGFDAGLNEFGRRIAPMAEYGAEIAAADRLPGARRGEVIARNRNGEIGPQAEFASGKIAQREFAVAAGPFDFVRRDAADGAHGALASFEEEMRLWRLVLESYRRQHWDTSQITLEILQTQHAGSPLRDLYLQIHARIDESFTLVYDALVSRAGLASVLPTAVGLGAAIAAPVTAAPAEVPSPAGELAADEPDDAGTLSDSLTARQLGGALQRWTPDSAETVRDRLASIVSMAMGYEPEDLPWVKFESVTSLDVVQGSAEAAIGGEVDIANKKGMAEARAPVPPGFSLALSRIATMPFLALWKAGVNGVLLPSRVFIKYFRVGPMLARFSDERIATLEFESANPSIVKSIKQRDFLNTWLRLYARDQSLPRMDDYRPERFREELPDLVFLAVEDPGDAHRRTIERGRINARRFDTRRERPQDESGNKPQTQHAVPRLRNDSTTQSLSG